MDLLLIIVFHLLFFSDFPRIRLLVFTRSSCRVSTILPSVCLIFDRSWPAHRLCNGPAKLCAAMAVDRRLDGVDMAAPDSPLWLEDWPDPPPPPPPSVEFDPVGSVLFSS